MIKYKRNQIKPLTIFLVYLLVLLNRTKNHQICMPISRLE